MTVLFAGGGTGGHLMPALACANAVRRLRPDARVVFAGTSRGLETEHVPRAGFELHLLPGAPVKGEGAIGALGGLAAAVKGIARARRLVRFVKPDVVVAVGGYASFAAGVAAFLSRVPLVVLEQNAIPGRVNRVLARLSRLCAVAFPEAARRLAGRRVEEIGNPVREDLLERFAKIRAEKNDGGFHLLVFGGSQGAHRLNEAAKEFAAGHPDRFADGFSMTHQTGPREIDGVRAFYADRNLPVDARAFIDDMAEAYARASLVFCRAGATTIAELTALGLPSVLVPYPFAADDHQRANAEYLESAGAAEIVNDADLTGGAMARIVDRLRQAPERLLAMADAARSLGKPQAADAIARRIVAMAGGA